jgi:choline dehydrogenase-like flavoprotein
VLCATRFGQRFAVKARYYILAGGGLEVPRLLLNSRSVQPAGVGNGYDLVGRFFTDHIDTFDAVVERIPQGFPRHFFRLNYESQQLDLEPTAAVGVSDAAMKRERLLNAAAFFVWRPEHKTDDAFYSESLRGALELIDVLKHRKPPSRRVIHSLTHTLAHTGKVLGVVSKAIHGRLNRRGSYVLNVQAETAPNPESRVLLDDSRDSLGLQQLSIRWKLSAQDLDSYRRFVAMLLQGLGACGLQIRPLRLDLDPEGWPVSLIPSRHHTGTTRMHSDPTRGVVDGDCRVHGVGNLFIASSSVFATVGMANPTVTIVALAVRLAAHLKQLLGKPAASL